MSDPLGILQRKLNHFCQLLVHLNLAGSSESHLTELAGVKGIADVVVWSLSVAINVHLVARAFSANQFEDCVAENIIVQLALAAYVVRLPYAPLCHDEKHCSCHVLRVDVKSGARLLRAGVAVNRDGFACKNLADAGRNEFFAVLPLAKHVGGIAYHHGYAKRVSV